MVRLHTPQTAPKPLPLSLLSLALGHSYLKNADPSGLSGRPATAAVGAVGAAWLLVHASAVQHVSAAAVGEAWLLVVHTSAVAVQHVSAAAVAVFLLAVNSPRSQMFSQFDRLRWDHHRCVLS